ncbi:uncharacterized protein [Rhodnius prolixus]
MSIIAKICNTIKPCIAKFVGLIDVILMLISGLVTSIVLLGVAMVQEQKIRQQEGQRIQQTEPVPTEEELAAWTLMAGGNEDDEQDEQCLEEFIEEELQLEQKMVTALETPHPYSLGDHNVHEDLSELILSQETMTPEEDAQK